jgi:hypothetical protein
MLAHTTKAVHLQAIHRCKTLFVRYNLCMREAKSARQDWLSVPRRRDEERLDPHVYARGINGLTVEEAVERAYPRVMAILRRSGEEYSEFEGQLVRQTIRACLISQVSRANLYRIAGILVADRRDEGAHLGRSLALAYVAALREAFLEDLSVGERVASPVGPGEVRYVSGDGSQAVVRLDGGSESEIWLPVVRLFRIEPEDASERRAS